MEKDKVVEKVNKKHDFSKKIKKNNILLVCSLIIEIILLVRFLTLDHFFILAGIGIFLLSFPKKWLRFRVGGNICMLLLVSILLILFQNLFDFSITYLAAIFFFTNVLVLINVFFHFKHKKYKKSKITPKIIVLMIIPLISLSTTLIYLPQTIQVNISGDNAYQDIVVDYLNSPHYREYGYIDPDGLESEYMLDNGKIDFYKSVIPKKYNLEFEYFNNLSITREYVEPNSLDNHLYFNSEEYIGYCYHKVPDWYNSSQILSNLEGNWSLVFENVILFKYSYEKGPSLFNFITIHMYYYSIGVITTTGIPISLWSYGYGCY